MTGLASLESSSRGARRLVDGSTRRFTTAGLVIVAALLVTDRVAERPVTAVAAGGLVAYGFLAFIGVYVP